jgi:hypothetical protein
VHHVVYHEDYAVYHVDFISASFFAHNSSNVTHLRVVCS